MARARTARTVIDAAIRENQKLSWMLFGLVYVSVTYGFICLAIGIINNNESLTYAGLCGTVFSSQVLVKLITVKQEMGRLRILEFALSKAKTGTEIASILASFFATKRR